MQCKGEHQIRRERAALQVAFESDTTCPEVCWKGGWGLHSAVPQLASDPSARAGVTFSGAEGSIFEDCPVMSRVSMWATMLSTTEAKQLLWLHGPQSCDHMGPCNKGPM